MKTKQIPGPSVARLLAVATLAGLACLGSVVSGSAQPVIITQPQWQTNCAGETAIFSVAATGVAPLSYQWRLRTGTTTFANIQDATNSTLTLENVQGVNNMSNVIASDSSGSVTSALTRLYVRQPVGFTQQPTNATREAGSTFYNFVAASNALEGYQWHFNGQPLPGRTNATLILTNVQPGDAGDYWAAAANDACGSTSSRVATLRVFTQGSRFTQITNGIVVNDLGGYWGSAWVDYDNDGYIDLFATRGGTVYNNVANRLYRNSRDGTFMKMTASAVGDIVTEITKFWGCTWGDYDNDGWADVCVVAYTNLLYRNVEGVFQRVYNTGVGLNYGWGCNVWGDYDRDGWLDLFEGSGDGSLGQAHNMLYHNEGDGAFSWVTTGPIYAQDVYASEKAAWGDYDGDGQPDLVVTSYVGGWGDRRAFLYRNLGAGQFERVTDNAIPEDPDGPLGLVWADYDNDGRLDLFLSLFNGQPNKLYHNLGHGDFSVSRIGQGGQNCTPAWGDYDNDGDLDLFIPRGQNVDTRNQFYQNNGDGTFTELTNIAPVNFIGRSHVSIWGDYDNDGFLDLFIPTFLTSDKGANRLYHNDGNRNHWIMLRLVGSLSNRAAIGARVRTLATIFGKRYWQMRDTGPSSSDGQNDPRAHFGLGDATNAEVVRIEWPSGQVTEMRDVAANRILTITEPPAIRPVSAAPAGAFQFELKSHRGMVWDLYASDHVHFSAETCACSNGYWKADQCVTNTTGTVVVTDTNVQGAAARFYKVEARSM